MRSECQGHGVKGIAEYIAHDEGEQTITVHGIIGKQCIESVLLSISSGGATRVPRPTHLLTVKRGSISYSGQYRVWDSH